MTASARGDVVIVGGGIVGMVTAYYLAKAGVPSVVIERDAIGSHASGYAYGGLSPVSGFGIPGPLAEVSQEGMRLHRELAESVVEETGIGIDFRVRSSLALAFTEADVQRLQSALPWQQRCGSGFWGGQRPSLADYVMETRATRGRPPPEGASVGYSLKLVPIRGGDHGPTFPGATNPPDYKAEMVKWFDAYLRKAGSGQ
jgi:glycine/D-amino acid oxidase-like deaminating enzyme